MAPRFFLFVTFIALSLLLATSLAQMPNFIPGGIDDMVKNNTFIKDMPDLPMNITTPSPDIPKA